MFTKTGPKRFRRTRRELPEGQTTQAMGDWKLMREARRERTARRADRRETRWSVLKD